MILVKVHVSLSKVAIEGNEEVGIRDHRTADEFYSDEQKAS